MYALKKEKFFVKFRLCAYNGYLEKRANPVGLEFQYYQAIFKCLNCGVITFTGGTDYEDRNYFNLCGTVESFNLV